MDLVKIVEKGVMQYKIWVRSNPATLSEVESAIRYLSYLLTSQFNDSNLVSELIYSAYKLLVFYNDSIIFCGIVSSNLPNPYENKLKKWLTIIDHCQVFIELSFLKAYGTRGKWFIVFFIQLFKSLIRLYLLFIKKKQIVEPCPIQCLDRKNFASQLVNASNSEKDRVSLKNGRVIRRLEAGSRTWKSVLEDSAFGVEDKKLNERQIVAEVIYICKPLVHLSSMYYFNSNSWKPWMLALLLDVTSLHVMSKTQPNELEKFSRRQHNEVTRRSITLLWYLMRSPFYDCKTKMQILAILKQLSRIPLVGIFFKSLIEYLPQWQQTYFYLWSS